MFIVDMSFEMQQLHQMERKSYQFKTTAGKKGRVIAPLNPLRSYLFLFSRAQCTRLMTSSGAE